MHVHILGIGGTFMAGVALLARAAGHRVTGSDKGLYPPMSTQLADAGIDVIDGYTPEQLRAAPDSLVIGNAMSRGNPAVEYALDNGLVYTSGPQWLAENVLQGRWVLAVAGTHGKTTTASMLAWILEYAGLSPGFLIGGIPGNFGESARLGNSDFFVVEADEYDTAFFDKRSKFIHYRPRTLVLNNLEFDHADIFDDLAAIKRQFHHLLRTIPASGQIISNAKDENLDAVLAQGAWSERATFADTACWDSRSLKPDNSHFEVLFTGDEVGKVHWQLTGEHNLHNALAAIAAARHVGVVPEQACLALCEFKGVKRRMELRGEVAGVRVYDDFAHHPTAIATTLAGVRASKPQGGGGGRIIAVLEPRSNTMRLGVHEQTLSNALQDADLSYVYQPESLVWDLRGSLAALKDRVEVLDDIEEIAAQVSEQARPGDCILVMSNGGFGGLHEKLLNALARD